MNSDILIPARALYLCLKHLGLTQEDITQRQGRTHAIIYLMQRFAVDLGYHFNWSESAKGPRDCYWDHGFGDLHLPHYLGNIAHYWEELSREAIELKPHNIKALKRFHKNFQQAFGCDISEHEKTGIKLYALSAFDYLHHVSRYSYAKANLYLAKQKIYRGQINPKKFRKILKQLEANNA